MKHISIALTIILLTLIIGCGDDIKIVYDGDTPTIPEPIVNKYEDCFEIKRKRKHHKTIIVLECDD